VLRDEHWMPTHGRLLAIPNRIRWREPPFDELGRVLHDGSASLHVQVGPLIRAKGELCAKAGAGQCVKEVFCPSHLTSPRVLGLAVLLMLAMDHHA
jgi:hypothetical protein